MERKLPLLRVLLIAFICCNTAITYAQNLVVNPSFEITSSNCANFGGEGFFTDLTGSWDNASNNPGGDSCSSPDLFSACNIAFTAMPNSSLGYQYSHTGTRHAGIITYEALDQYREYIQGHLTSPLVAGQTYCVSMFVSLANEMPYATNNMGIYFSNTHYLRDPCPNSGIYVTPQLNYTCSAITDTSANWFRLQWNYVATGGEMYFVIGNFFNNANTTVVNTGKPAFPNPFAYYYIDDVSVVPNTCCYAEIVNHVPVCPSASAFNLTVTGGTGGTGCTPTLNGTWSGTGITNATNGTFNPAVAGVGNHLISYTLPCGYVDTMTMKVSPCLPFTVCLESNGNLTASGGVGSFSWSKQVQVQDCSGCLPAVPPFIAPCSIPAGCAVMVNAWQHFADGYTITPPSYPIQVYDIGQPDSILVINSAGSVSPCSVVCSLTASALPVNTTCGLNNGGASVSVSGGTATAYQWSNSGSTASISNLAAGNYTVTVTAGACSATASATVGSSAGITAGATSTNTGCTNTGTATATISGGTASGYLWSNSGTTATISGLGAGTYTVAVTSTNNCTATASTTVTATAGLTATASSTNASCGGSNGSATVTVTSGTATGYSWSSGANTATAPNLAAGNYTVTVTGSGGCSATASTVVGSTGAPTINTTSVAATCGNSNGSATVNVTSGTATGYNWSSSATTATASNLAAGTYTVTVTGTGGCTVTATATVGSTGAPVINTTTVAATCGNSNGSATVNVTSGTATGYNWSSSATTATASNLAAGTYTVTVTGTGGCTATASATVGSTGAPTLSTSVTGAACNSANGSATVTVTSGTATAYNWSSGANTATASNLAAGTYTVTVTATGGCTATATAIVTATSGVAITAAATNTTCGNNNGTATVTVTAGTASTYSWSNGGTTATLTGLASGSYTVTVSDAGGCSVTASVTINGSVGNTVVVTSDKTVMCSNDSAHVCATAGFVSYLWNTGATGTCLYTQLAGNYYVTVTDAANCTASSNHLAISVHPQPPVSISVNGDTLLAYNSLSYQWYFNGQLIQGATNPMYIVTQAGSYTVLVGDANGCSALSLPVIAGITGVDDLQKERLAIYPNPNNDGKWNLLVGKAWINSQYEVFDADGRLVVRSVIENPLSEINLQVAKGVYFIRLSSGTKVITQKLIKL